MLSCPADSRRTVWLFTQPRQLCHQRDRKSLRESHEPQGVCRPLTGASRPEIFPFRKMRKMRETARTGSAKPSRTLICPNWGLAGFRLKRKTRCLSRTNRKCTFSFNYFLIAYKQDPSWMYPLRRWLFRRQNTFWVCLQKTAAFFG